MNPDFEIPARPTRRFPRGGSVEYHGSVTLRLLPSGNHDDRTLQQLVDDVLDENTYVHGDWFDLPVPVYLVRDHEVGSSFRVSVRYGRIELHVLPETRVEALERFYERLTEQSLADTSADELDDEGQRGENWEIEWYVERGQS